MTKDLATLKEELAKALKPIAHGIFVPGSTMDSRRMQDNYVFDLRTQISQMEHAAVPVKV